MRQYLGDHAGYRRKTGRTVLFSGTTFHRLGEMGAVRAHCLEGTNSGDEHIRRERELTEAITPAVESTLPGVEVLAVELLSPARFCVYVDHPDGVDLALCRRVTRLLDSYRTDWTVDVSSPGPERPVRRPEHFRRAIGGTVKLKTAGARRVRGTLVAADEHAVTVSVDGTAHEIPVDEIVRGNLIDEGR